MKNHVVLATVRTVRELEVVLLPFAGNLMLSPPLEIGIAIEEGRPGVTVNPSVVLGDDPNPTMGGKDGK
jgi:hypothetical protein